MILRNKLFPAGEEDLWKRNLYILCIAQFVAMIGMSGVFPFLPLYVRELGIENPQDANFWSGLVFAGTYFSAVIMIPFWGSMGDKYGRKVMVIRAVFGLALSVALMAFAQNVYQLFFLRFLQGTMSGMIASALAFVSADSPEEKSGYSIGMLQASIAAGQVFGPFFGGAMADFVGIRYVFLIVGFLCLVAGFLVMSLLKERNFVPQKDKTYGIIGNLRYSLKNPIFRKLLFLVVLVQMGVQFTIPVFAYFVETLEAPNNLIATVTGSLFGIVAIFNISFASTWGKRNDNKVWQKTLRVSSLIVAFMFILHIVVPSYQYLFPIRAIIGIFYAALIPTLYSALSKRAPSERKGGIMGLASGANLFGSLLSFLFSGVVASILGIEFTFVISFILLLLVAFLAKMTPYDKYQIDYYESKGLKLK